MKRKFSLIVLYILSLIFLARSAYGDYLAIMILLSVGALLSSLHYFSYLQSLIRTILVDNKLDLYNLKKRLILFILFLAVYLMVKKAAPKEWLLFFFDNATFIFFGYLALMFLMKVSSAVNGYFAIIGVILMAFYSLFKFDVISETFAVLTFFFFAVSVLQAIKEQAITGIKT